MVGQVCVCVRAGGEQVPLGGAGSEGGGQERECPGSKAGLVAEGKAGTRGCKYYVERDKWQGRKVGGQAA